MKEVVNSEAVSKAVAETEKVGGNFFKRESVGPVPLLSGGIDYHIEGMVDEALIARGKAPISRSCEVPEFKHACLGGVYGMKGAIRHLALDGAGSQAIVVCADIAEYARGSSGEPTQGAGAVVMVVDDARVAAVDDGYLRATISRCRSRSIGSMPGPGTYSMFQRISPWIC